MTWFVDAGPRAGRRVRSGSAALATAALLITVMSQTGCGVATLAFRIDPDADRPGFTPVGAYPNEIKVAYDGTDDTIWYSSDAGTRIYHYQTYADAQGTVFSAMQMPPPSWSVAASRRCRSAERN